MYSQHYNLDVSMGDVIRTILRRKGITQSDFAHKMGFKKANASNLISRKDWPISKILQASEVLEEQLLTYYLKKKDYEYSVQHENQLSVSEAETEYKTTALNDCREQNSFLKEHIELMKKIVQNLEAELKALKSPAP